MMLTTVKSGGLVTIKQTRDEADHSKRGALLIKMETRHEADHSKGSFGNYKADAA